MAITFLQQLWTVGAFQGILLSILLFFYSATTLANKILGAWCLLLGLSFLAHFITVNGTLNEFSVLIGWFNFFPASYGALLYLYCHHAMTNNALSRKDLLHLLPVLLCYMLNIDILFSSPDVKLGWILVEPPQSLQFTMSQYIMYSQAFIYWGACILLIRRYQQTASKTLSNFNPDTFKWIWQLLILYVTIWSLKTVAAFNSDWSFLSSLGSGLIVILIYSIAMAQWRNPQLFRIEQLDIENTSNSNLRGDKADDTDNGDNGDNGDNTSVEKSGALDENTRKNLLEAVQLYMQQQKAFTNNCLTLSNLSQAIGVSTHHLSEVLNQQQGKNFYQFVNEYRINYVCQQIKHNHSTTLLALAMDAGFSSKSTFNAVFKQFTGMTPSQYRKSIHQH